jgi:hypothetical protein
VGRKLLVCVCFIHCIIGSCNKSQSKAPIIADQHSDGVEKSENTDQQTKVDSSSVDSHTGSPSKSTSADIINFKNMDSVRVDYELEEPTTGTFKVKFTIKNLDNPSQANTVEVNVVNKKFDNSNVKEDGRVLYSVDNNILVYAWVASTMGHDINIRVCLDNPLNNASKNNVWTTSLKKAEVGKQYTNSYKVNV